MSLNNAILESLNTTKEAVISQLEKDVFDIFSTMVGVQVTPQAILVESVETFTDSVSAMVGMAGIFNGVVTLHCSKKMAIHFASEMLGAPATEIDNDVIDALGEIANMLGGSFKHHFVLNGQEVKLSIPSVISGQEYGLAAGSIPDTMTLKFEAAGEAFLISLYLEEGD